MLVEEPTSDNNLKKEKNMFTKKNLKKETKKTKKETTKKVEDKKIETEKNDYRDEGFKEVIQECSKMKNIRGYIVLVDAKKDEEEGKGSGTGLNAVSGKGLVLCNLLGNLNPELMKQYKRFEELVKVGQALDGLDGILRAVLRDSKN